MEQVRKPFQGILNIIRFNWHFFVIAIAVISSALILVNFTNSTIGLLLQIMSFLIAITVLVSLAVSYYVYDLSGFYNLDWIQKNEQQISVININAGFDETSTLLKNKFKNATFAALDFYDPLKHTEVSIKRARKQYPPFPNTLQTDTSIIDLESSSVDKVFLILAAHEIRNEAERITFFKELHRILKPKGQIYITEHLRDVANFTAYNIGAFHFHSKSSWLKTFNKSEFTLKSEIKNTPFISTFTLEQNGNTL